MQAISQMGDEMGLMVIICTFYVLGYTTEMMFFLLALLFGNVVNSRMKLFFELSRPPDDMISKLYNADGYGYPSGHSQTGMLYAWLFYSFIKKYWFVCLLAAFVMAASRIYLGVHYFSDTVGGLLLGFGVVVGATGIYGYLRDQNNLHESLRRSPALGIVLGFAISFAYLAFAWGLHEATRYAGFLGGFFVVYPMLGFRWRTRNMALAAIAIVVGLLALLFLRLGLSAVFPRTGWGHYCRYFIVGAVLAVAPLVFVKLRLLERIVESSLTGSPAAGVIHDDKP